MELIPIKNEKKIFPVSPGPSERNKMIDPNSVALATYNLKMVKPLPQVQTLKTRPISPRVKPPAHFARVAANILCHMSCKRPLSPPSVYADFLASKFFQESPYHDEKAFQLYIEYKYGSKFVRKDIFLEDLPKIEPPPPECSGPNILLHSVQNKNCWLPIYRKGYLKKLSDGINQSCGAQEKDYGGQSKWPRYGGGTDGRTRPRYGGGSGGTDGRTPNYSRKDGMNERTFQTGFLNREKTNYSNGQPVRKVRPSGKGQEDFSGSSKMYSAKQRHKASMTKDEDFGDHLRSNRPGAGTGIKTINDPSYAMNARVGLDAKISNNTMGERILRKLGPQDVVQNKTNKTGMLKQMFRDEDMIKDERSFLEFVSGTEIKTQNNARRTSYDENIYDKSGQPILHRVEAPNLFQVQSRGQTDYKFISENIDTFKIAFRKEALAKGLDRPTTAQITNAMKNWTPLQAKTIIDDLIAAGTELSLMDPMREMEKIASHKLLNKKSVSKKIQARRDKEADLSKSRSEVLDKSRSQVLDKKNRSQVLDKKSRSQVWTKKKSRSKSVKSKTNVAGDFSGEISGVDDGEFSVYDEEEDDYIFKLPNLAVREKVSLGQTVVQKEKEQVPLKLPSLKAQTQVQDEQEYEDKLLFPTNSNQDANLQGDKKRRSTYNEDTEMTRVSQIDNQVCGKSSHLGEGDQVDVNAVNPRWETPLSPMFKSPLKTPAIPLPENLVIHIEKKFPRFQWPRGVPVALRYYPSGQPFCVVFQNGAGRVHYPHGGIAVVISAPAPYYSRVLVIRDPFDQFYFFDKAILADLNCNGKGLVYDDQGIMKLEYNLQGGYRQDGLNKPSQRWQWNQGGQRFTIKLNRYCHLIRMPMKGYMSLRILDLNKIYLVFYGNKRGFRLNVGAGRKISLMSVTCDNSSNSLPSANQGRLLTDCEGFDYIRGKLVTPVLGIGFFENQKTSKGNNQNGRCKTAPNYYPPGEATCRYRFSQCNLSCEVTDPMTLAFNCYCPQYRQKS